MGNKQKNICKRVQKNDLQKKNDLLESVKNTQNKICHGANKSFVGECKK